MAVTPIGALMHQAQTRAESAAFVFHEEVWTYRRLADEAERVARGLVARGVKAGERVALHMMNRPEMLVAYYACLQTRSHRSTVTNRVQICRARTATAAA